MLKVTTTIQAMDGELHHKDLFISAYHAQPDLLNAEEKAAVEAYLKLTDLPKFSVTVTKTAADTIQVQVTSELTQEEYLAYAEKPEVIAFFSQRYQYHLRRGFIVSSVSE